MPTVSTASNSPPPEPKISAIGSVLATLDPAAPLPPTDGGGSGEAERLALTFLAGGEHGSTGAGRTCCGPTFAGGDLTERRLLTRSGGEPAVAGGLAGGELAVGGAGRRSGVARFAGACTSVSNDAAGLFLNAPSLARALACALAPAVAPTAARLPARIL
eukprot:9048519-Pyramimonas_sp.AAC.1